MQLFHLCKPWKTYFCKFSTYNSSGKLIFATVVLPRWTWTHISSTWQLSWELRLDLCLGRRRRMDCQGRIRWRLQWCHRGVAWSHSSQFPACQALHASRTRPFLVAAHTLFLRCIPYICILLYHSSIKLSVFLDIKGKLLSRLATKSFRKRFLFSLKLW